MTNQENQRLLTYCECGCKQVIFAFDKYGKRRRYVLGHANRGKRATKESRKKMSDSHTGVKLSVEHKENLRKSHLGLKVSEKTKKKLSDGKLGSKNPMYGNHHTIETIEKLRVITKNRSEELIQQIAESNRGSKRSKETKLRMSKAQKGNTNFKGKTHTDEAKRKISKGKLGKKNPQWQGGISHGKYCPKFNEKIKEEIRERFGYMCLLCGKHQTQNGQRLSIHHVDYNKQQGCDKYKWTLVPLCKACHAKTNNDRPKWERRINIFLDIMGA